MQTSRDIYLARLKRAAAILLVVAVTVYAMAPARWFSFYGWAAILLAAAALFSYPLLDRLRAIGRNRALALFFIIPAVLIGLVQIGYWLAFFRFGPTNPAPGVVRELFWINAGFAVPYAVTGLAALWAWLFWSPSRIDA
jgi:hypothetical protein